jgi:hypothetical protein
MRIPTVVNESFVINVHRKMTFLRSPLSMPLLWPFAGLADEELKQVRKRKLNKGRFPICWSRG